MSQNLDNAVEKTHVSFLAPIFEQQGRRLLESHDLRVYEGKKSDFINVNAEHKRKFFFSLLVFFFFFFVFFLSFVLEVFLL